MEILGLPQWTLSARLEGETLEFTLGDSRRLSWRSRRPAAWLAQVQAEEPGAGPASAADLLGDELAERLARSAPRALSVQYEAALDGIGWEHLSLGPATLAAHHALARQLLSSQEAARVPDSSLADELRATAVHGAALPEPAAGAAHTGLQRVALSSLDQPGARDVLALSHVLVLSGVAPGLLLQRGCLPTHEHLLVTSMPLPQAERLAALDAGAALLQPGPEGWPADTLDALLLQLGGGASVGEAVRWLHRRAAPARLGLRLYGDPATRFVRALGPDSRRQVTSLSFDIVGSTTMLSEQGDEAYAEALAQVHARCTGIVRRLGGRPDAPQGNDGVMCYFGHPSAQEDSAVRAVETGLLIIRSVAELGVAVRVGIATGLVAIKADQPVGLSIHLAARLQKLAAPGTVLLADATRRLVEHAFRLQPLDDRPALKGIADTQGIYRLLGASADASQHRLERQAWLTPLVGRRAELERLHQCWRHSQGGACQLAVVRAEAGMGKSRVVREFRQQLAQADVRVLECHCRADASASPFLALAEALRRWLDIAADAAPASALPKLAAALPQRLREGEPLALLAALLGLIPQPQQAAPSAPGGLRQRLLGLLLDWFLVFAQDRPCCLIVEDWHWVDPSTHEFVEHLAQRSGGTGLLVVVTLRVESAVPPPGFAHSEHIELAGLQADEARELVNLVCASAPLPAGLVRTLAARGDGVPLFLEEAARMALELGAERLASDRGALQTVPASLQDLLTARLDTLGAAKPVAQVAAVLGREFSLAPLTALLEGSGHAQDALRLPDLLHGLVSSGLVRAEGGGQFAFRHALIRDAAYASLWARDRQALHARMVELLRQRWPELAALQPELLALHQTEAGLHEAALAQWELAASNATARSAEVEAISHLRRALGVLTRLEPGTARDRTALRLQLLLAARLIATEGYGAEAVLQAYREAERLCLQLEPQPGDETVRFRVEMGLEAYRFMRAEFGLALEHGQRAAAIAARSGDIKQRLHAHWGLACTLFHQGQLRATMREMDTALALWSPPMHRLFGVQDPGVMCLAYTSWGLWELGRPDAALARINEAVALATGFEHKWSLAVALAYGVSIELLRGDSQAALARAATCIGVCEEAGFPVWLAITRCMRGRLLCELGQFDVGLSEIRAGYALWLSTGAQVSQPLYLALQAEALMLAGQHAAATACVDEGQSIIDRYGERQLEAELWRLRGELALQRGDTAQAEAALKRAYALALRQHKLGFALRAGTTLCGIWLAGGRRDRARRLLLPLLARWHEGHETRDVRRALALARALD